MNHDEAVGPGDPADGDPSGGDVRDTDRLVCGADTDRLLGQVAEGRGEERDAHQLECRHCRATLAEFSRLWAPVTASVVATESVRAPAGLLDDVFAAIREAAEPPGVGVVLDEDGATRIAARVVVGIAAEAARAVPGVRMALGGLAGGGAGDGSAGGRVVDAGEPQVTVGLAGRTVSLDIVVAADYGQSLPDLVERLRAHVRDHVRALTDLRAVEIDVVVDDVLPPR